MNKAVLLILCILFFLSACVNDKTNSDQSYLIEISFNGAKEISSNTIIIYGDTKIGEVVDIRLDAKTSKFIAIAKINKGLVIPAGSVFLLSKPDFFGDYTLIVDLKGAKIANRTNKFIGYSLEYDINSIESDNKNIKFESDSAFKDFFPMVGSLFNMKNENQ